MYEKMGEIIIDIDTNDPTPTKEKLEKKVLEKGYKDNDDIHIEIWGRKCYFYPEKLNEVIKTCFFKVKTISLHFFYLPYGKNPNETKDYDKFVNQCLSAFEAGTHIQLVCDKKIQKYFKICY